MMQIIPRKPYALLNSYLRQDVEFNSYLQYDVEVDSYLRQDVEFNSYIRLDDLAQIGQVQSSVDGKIFITADGKKRRVYR